MPSSSRIAVAYLGLPKVHVPFDTRAQWHLRGPYESPSCSGMLHLTFSTPFISCFNFSISS
eukprot:9075594-Heterocapsa_arctica.AAC.1